MSAPSGIASIGSELVEGWCDWVRGHAEHDLPRAEPRAANAVKWWLDEWSLQAELASRRMRIPDPLFRRRLRGELDAAHRLFADRGWLDDPRSYHRDPPPLADVTLKRDRFGALGIERFRFDSGFEPWPEEPGRERWLGYPSVQQGAGWILRHDDGPRPWLCVINGYRTGRITTDLGAFRVGHLHRDLGLNIVNVSLPLHGPRTMGDTSGSRVFNAGAMNTIFTIAHGAWDIRRVLGWLRADLGADTIGLSGISLGGYMVALVSCLDDDLACVVAGVPESDLVRGLRRQLDPLLPPFYEQWGLSWGPLEQILTPVSPLAMPCLVPRDRRYIYAGLIDRWVRPGNVKALWEHWDEPSILWYEGSHMSFPFERSVRSYVDRALAQALPVG